MPIKARRDQGNFIAGGATEAALSSEAAPMRGLLPDQKDHLFSLKSHADSGWKQQLHQKKPKW